MSNEPDSSKTGHYAICVKGLLDSLWDWLTGFTVTQYEHGETCITGIIMDQAALHGILARIRDLNLTLLSVEQIESYDP